jgi:hypothetical protein
MSQGMSQKASAWSGSAPEKPLTQEQVARVLAQLGKRDEMWLALMQLLQVRLASAIRVPLASLYRYGTRATLAALP